MKPYQSKAALVLIHLLLVSCSEKHPSSRTDSDQGTSPEEARLPQVATAGNNPPELEAITEKKPDALPGTAVQPIPTVGLPTPKEALQQSIEGSREPETVEAAACLTFNYQHHASARHTLGPDCVHHKNRLELPSELLRGGFDLNALCVRVDGTPVMALRENGTLILGATPKSRSVVSIKGCRRGTTCKESCKIPKDELIQELAGDSDAAGGGWDEESAFKVSGAVDDEIKRELAALDEEEISKEWVLTGAPAEQLASACRNGERTRLSARKKN